MSNFGISPSSLWEKTAVEALVDSVGLTEDAISRISAKLRKEKLADAQDQYEKKTRFCFYIFLVAIALTIPILSVGLRNSDLSLSKLWFVVIVIVLCFVGIMARNAVKCFQHLKHLTDMEVIELAFAQGASFGAVIAKGETDTSVKTYGQNESAEPETAPLASKWAKLSALLICVFVAAVGIITWQDGETVYRFYNNGVWLSEIGRHDIKNGVVVVPAEIKGEPVVAIGRKAFKDNEKLVEVQLPESITEIGAHAFSGCTNLTAINIPSGVTVLHDGTFYRCEKLTEIKLPEGLQHIGDDSSSLNTDGAFEQCCGLTEIHLPESLVSIGRYSFHKCEDLTEVTINTQLKVIDARAFDGCDKLKRVNVPPTCAVQNNAFDDSVVVEWATAETIYHIENQEAYLVVIGKEDIQNGTVTIPELYQGLPVVGINERAMAHQQDIQRIVLPASIRTIASEAFVGCTALKEIRVAGSTMQTDPVGTGESDAVPCAELPVGLTSIGERAFFGCSSLARVEIPDSLQLVHYDSFDDCPQLTYLYLPISCELAGKRNDIEVEYIQLPKQSAYLIENDQAILYMSGAEDLVDGHVVIPEMYDGLPVVGIAPNAFLDRVDIESITFPSGLTTIGENAFEGCKGLTTVTLPDGMTTLPEDAFSGCINLRSVNLPQGITEIESGCFCYCSALEEITLPSTLRRVGALSFAYCSALKNIVIPEGVEDISSHAFYGCKNLTAVTLPVGLTTLHADAFNNCTALENIALPEGITQISARCFQNCTALKEVALPTTLTEVGEAAFMGCTALERITLPDGVTKISAKTFSGCTSLMTVMLPAGITTLHADTFKDCTSLKNVLMQEGITEISARCFQNCTALEEISLPSTVLELGESVFEGCKGLQTITIPDGVLKIPAKGFYGCTSLASIQLPDVMPDGKISESAFYQSGLTSIHIPQGVTKISAHAFRECRSLRSVTIPSSLEEIGSSAFRTCKSLREISIPKTCSVNERAFKDTPVTITRFQE